MNGYTQKEKKTYSNFFYKRLIQFIFSSFCRLELNEKIRDWERVSERVWGGLYIPRALPSCLHSVAQTYAIRISQDEECCSKCQIGVVKEAVDGLYVLPSCLFFHVFVRSSFLFVMQRAYKVKWGSVGYNSLKKKKKECITQKATWFCDSRRFNGSCHACLLSRWRNFCPSRNHCVNLKGVMKCALSSPLTGRITAKSVVQQASGIWRKKLLSVYQVRTRWIFM